MHQPLTFGMQIIIDHATKDGFQCVGDARDYLLRKGRKQAQRAHDSLGEPQSSEASTLGTHVVAPVSLIMASANSDSNPVVCSALTTITAHSTP